MHSVIGRGKKIHDCEMQSPTRETRVLPGHTMAIPQFGSAATKGLLTDFADSTDEKI
jgi:hypothetical protein